MKDSKFKTIMLLTLVNFLGNFIFFITISILLFSPKFFTIHQSYLIVFFTIIGLSYYIVLLILTGHYTILFREFVKNNTDLFYAIVWFSAYILGFIIFYFLIDKNTAWQIFGGGAVLYILEKGIKSFKYWKSNRNTKKDRTGKSKKEST